MREQDLEYSPRNCDICGGTDSETIYSYERRTETRQYAWDWRVDNMICRHCGFTFVSPAPSERALEIYYTDSPSLFANQKPDYSVDKRIKIIGKYLKQLPSPSYVEIGSNKCPEFMSALHELIPEEQIQTVEYNDSCDATYLSLNDLPNDSYNMITTYFVLEHVPHPRKFLERCHEICQDSGYLIIEIPNLYTYPSDPSALILYEHVNHFSPVTLSVLAESCGFELVEISQHYCSRPYGFLTVFKKSRPAPNTSVPANSTEIHMARFSMLEGVEEIDSFQNKLIQTRQRIDEVSSRGKTVILWAANGMCGRLLENYTPPDSMVLVDINEQKKTSFKKWPVLLPEEAVDKIKGSGLLVVNSARHVDEICEWIRIHANHNYDTRDIIICDYVDMAKPQPEPEKDENLT